MGRWDNLDGDWVYQALDAALQTGALRRCTKHHDVILSQKDDAPEPAIDALNLLDRELREEGFGDQELSTLQTDLIFVLQWADEFCPSCGPD